VSEATRDWPIALKVNDAAAELAPTIYYLQHRVYGGSGKMFEALSESERGYYRDVAEALLRTVAPSERQKPTPTTLKLVTRPDDSEWCAQCHTRQVSKHNAPYCSTLCRETAYARR